MFQPGHYIGRIVLVTMARSIKSLESSWPNSFIGTIDRFIDNETLVLKDLVATGVKDPENIECRFVNLNHVAIVDLVKEDEEGEKIDAEG